MDDGRWISILLRQKNLDEDDKAYDVQQISNEAPFFLMEAFDKESSADESFLVYDCSDFSDDDSFDAHTMEEFMAEHSDAYPVIVFRNWEHERKIFRKYYGNLKKASDRKAFSSWYDKKLSIYVESDATVIMEVEGQGINYLEYPETEPLEGVLHGKVYNVSFFELKKLFNVTGAHLFVKNVRFGLQHNTIGDTLRSKFHQYLAVAIYQKIQQLELPQEVLDELEELFGIDEEISDYLKNDKEGPDLPKDGEILLPKNFWFYHNGISIYSSEKILETPSNRIHLSPNKVSVINGAQTLTNFFLQAEEAQLQLDKVLRDRPEYCAESIIESIIKSIFVKTIIIYGDSRFIRSITHGLNTQIPILEESLLADSTISESINEKLVKSSPQQNRIRILKDGELWKGDRGVSVLEFVKNWLTVNGEPGKSKNLSKKDLESRLSQINQELETDSNSIYKLETLFQVYQWWDDAKKQRIGDEVEDSDAIAIGKYGRNYFGTYVTHILADPAKHVNLDESFLSICYERFVQDLKIVAASSNIPIVMRTFKLDELSKKMLAFIDSHTNVTTDQERIPETLESDIKKLLNQEGQSAYTFAKSIADYLLQKDVSMDYFRVISRTKGRCKEAFPFPNSTFNEIVEAFLEENPEPKDFEKSALAQTVRTSFPVFVIDKDEENNENGVTAVHYIPEFSFATYEEKARQVYDETVEAFVSGNEQAFPRSGEGKAFHVRPKAANADDNFQFTNGDYITKRTFWANKSTVDDLINKNLRPQ